MLLRLNTPKGIKRIQFETSSGISQLKKTVAEMLDLEMGNFEIYTEQNHKTILSDLSTLENGSMIYIKDFQQQEKVQKQEMLSASQREDDIDVILSKQDGWIQRERDDKLCQHNKNAKCNWCMPIPPWEILNIDPWKEKEIHHIPLHSYFKQIDYLKKEMTGLTMPNYAPKPLCRNHEPYPAGICTECAPSAVRLNTQKWRAVDYLGAEDQKIIGAIISAWQSTGMPKCGWMYGQYEPYSAVPLGIQATLKAIYEPPQRIVKGEAILDEDPDEELVDEVAHLLGLKKIGYIWVDIQSDKKTGKVMEHRKNGEFWSYELIRAAKMQNAFPNVCKKSAEGVFGSKFVSAVITGQDDNIQVFAKQVSNQAMSLVRDQVIVASSTDLSKMKVRKAADTRVVPDVMYTTQNEYDREVVVKADPYFPSDFLVIPVPSGSGASKGSAAMKIEFPIENRLDKAQSLSILKDHVDQYRSNLSFGLNDFHLLVFFAKQVRNNAVVKKVVQLIQSKNDKELNTFFSDFLKDVPSAKKPNNPPVSRPTTTPSQSTPAYSSPSHTTPTRPPALTSNQKEAIQTLVGMGFSESSATEALKVSNWDVTRATDYIFNNM